MKKFTLTVFGLFLVAVTFANVTPVKVEQTQIVAKTTLTANKAQVTQISKVMAITSKASIGGVRGVIATCATATRCQDDM